VGCLAVVGVALSGNDGLQTSANVAQLVSVVLAVPALAVPLLLWSRGAAGSVVATPDAVATAKDVLAGLVDQQWRTEAILRSLDDPDPIPVRWRVAGDDQLVDHSANLTPASLPLTASSDDITALACEFRAMRRRRLVILGGPGTGKTTLAVLLLRELLAARQGHEDEPVPMLLSVAGWDTGVFPRLQDWLALRLARDYPALRATALGSDAPTTLAERGQILPVLDGLDELPPAAQAAIITALNRSLSGTDQLIVTSRTTDYRRAVGAARNVLTSAVVIEPDPLDPSAVAEHLRRCLPPRPGPVWEQILAHLRITPAPPAGPIAALADITATPLGLWLLRAVYITPGADPAALLDPVRFPDTATLRAHLFDQLIGALIDTRLPSTHPADLFRPRRRHDSVQVRHRLGYLAHHLTHPRNADGSPRTRDLAWWYLARTTHTITRTTRLTIGLTIALTITLTAAFLTGLAEGLPAGLTEGLAYGLASGLAAGLVVALAARSWPQQAPGFADLRIRGRLPGPALRLAAGLARGLAIGLAAGLAMGFAVSLQVGLTVGLPAGLATVLAVSLTYWLAAGLTAWAEAPTPTGRANTPLTSWRADRTLNLMRAAVIGLTSGLAGGLAGGLTAGLTDTPAFGLAVGLTFGLTLGLPAGLAAGHRHAWMAYVIATSRLALAGRLPRHLMPFLDDAHRLGLLRAVGPIYQFRHADLHDHLATTYHPHR
jgi:hypothetical protein